MVLCYYKPLNMVLCYHMAYTSLSYRIFLPYPISSYHIPVIVSCYHKTSISYGKMFTIRHKQLCHIVCCYHMAYKALSYSIFWPHPINSYQYVNKCIKSCFTTEQLYSIRHSCETILWLNPLVQYEYWNMIWWVSFLNIQTLTPIKWQIKKLLLNDK